MDSFTQSTTEQVTAAMRAAGHVPAKEGREGHSGFKITAAGTPGTVRLEYFLYANPHYTDAGYVKRTRPGRTLEHLGRYTLDLLDKFHIHLASSPQARYLLVSQHTVQETHEIHVMMVRAAMMDLWVKEGEAYHAFMEDNDPDTIRITFTCPEGLSPRTVVALTAAEALLKEQGWTVVDHKERGLLFVWTHGHTL